MNVHEPYHGYLLKLCTYQRLRKATTMSKLSGLHTVKSARYTVFALAREKIEPAHDQIEN